MDHETGTMSADTGTISEPGPRAAALELDACVLRHVSRLSRAVVAAYDPALAAHGLTGHQFNLMTTLHRMGPMSVGDLAAALGMDPSGIPRAVRPLVDVGLIQSEAGEDRRRPYHARRQQRYAPVSASHQYATRHPH